jgi:Na+-translocating ferredoxin:NAD+ oxidoreductase RnfD subunit
MTRFGFDAVGAYVLTVALAAILAAVLVSQLQRSKKAFAAGLSGALLGILLGCIIPVALLKASGYIVLAGNVFWVDTQDDGGSGDGADAREPARETRRGGREAGERP